MCDTPNTFQPRVNFRPLHQRRINSINSPIETGQDELAFLAGGGSLERKEKLQAIRSQEPTVLHPRHGIVEKRLTINSRGVDNNANIQLRISIGFGGAVIMMKSQSIGWEVFGKLCTLPLRIRLLPSCPPPCETPQESQQEITPASVETSREESLNKETYNIRQISELGDASEAPLRPVDTSNLVFQKERIT